MTAPMFSVLLPSKDRPELLSYAIESVLRQPFGDFEIIVSDNASVAAYQGLVAQFGDDRIRYCRVDPGVAVTDNWNNALALATGRYVVMLGDDDALAPGYFETMAKTIDCFDEPDAIHFGAYHYCYPGAMPSEPDGFLSIVLTGPLFLGVTDTYRLLPSRARALAQKALKFHHHFGFNSQYFVWRRASMPMVARGGDFFRTPYPDYYSSIMTFLNAQNTVVIPRPQVIIGISPKSFGHYFFGGDESGGAVFLGHSLQAAPAGDPDAVPGSDHNTKWLLAMREVQSVQTGAMDLELGVNNYRRLQIVESVRRSVVLGDNSALSALRPQLRRAETVFATSLIASLRIVGWRRPHSQGALVLSLVGRILDQDYPPAVTRLEIGEHNTILDALNWLESEAKEGGSYLQSKIRGPGK